MDLYSYMLSKTRGHVDMLDPTGNRPWFPTDATLIKNWKFGTGRAEPDVLDMMQRKYKQLVRFTSYVHGCFKSDHKRHQIGLEQNAKEKKM